MQQLHAEATAIHSPHGRTATCDDEPETDFVLRNQARVFSIIYRIVRNHEDARDISQEALYRAVQKRDQVKDDRLLDHWLSRVAKNAAIDFVRRSKVCGYPNTLALGNLVSRYGDTEGSLIKKERVEHLWRLLAILTERERRAVTLRDLEGLPASDVATCMGCAPATVRSHIQNAMEKLRKHPGLHDNMRRTEHHQSPNSLLDIL